MAYLFYIYKKKLQVTFLLVVFDRMDLLDNFDYIIKTEKQYIKKYFTNILALNN